MSKKRRSRSAATATAPTKFVSLFLRGGADGLTFCAPYDDPIYQANRPHLGLLPPGNGGGTPDPRAAIHLSDATPDAPAFGMAAALEPLKDLYDDDKLVFVHATGSMDDNRSHFDQQSKVELGELDDTADKTGTGWLGRYLAETPPGQPKLRAISFSSFAAAAFAGGDGVTPTTEPDKFQFPGDAAFQRKLVKMYEAVGDETLVTALKGDLEAADGLAAVDFSDHAIGYPNNDLGDAFRKTSAMFSAPSLDLEMVNIDFDNVEGQRWDTHEKQGSFVKGEALYNLMDSLATTLRAFIDDMDAKSIPVCVLVVTEFGRTLAENSGLGTDHGRGGVAMLLGDHVQEGKVETDWPGLEDENLSPPNTGHGDLAVTIDIRQVQGEVVHKVLGDKALVEKVFPDSKFEYQSLNILKPLP